MTYAFDFMTSYKQLTTTQRVFVDGFVADVENRAVVTNTHMFDVLNEPLLPGTDERILQMLSVSIVRAAITERVRELVDAQTLSTHNTLKELQAMSYSNIGDYMTLGGDGLPVFDFTSCTPEQLSAIESVEFEERPQGGKKFKLKLHSKTTAITLMMKYQNLLDGDAWDKEKPPQSNEIVTVNDTVENAADRYAALIG